MRTCSYHLSRLESFLVEKDVNDYTLHDVRTLFFHMSDDIYFNRLQRHIDTLLQLPLRELGDIKRNKILQHCFIIIKKGKSEEQYSLFGRKALDKMNNYTDICFYLHGAKIVSKAFCYGNDGEGLSQLLSHIGEVFSVSENCYWKNSARMILSQINKLAAKSELEYTSITI